VIPNLQLNHTQNQPAEGEHSQGKQNPRPRHENAAIALAVPDLKSRIHGALGVPQAR
jgi:hypothetical protein